MVVSASAAPSTSLTVFFVRSIDRARSDNGRKTDIKNSGGGGGGLPRRCHACRWSSVSRLELSWGCSRWRDGMRKRWEGSKRKSAHSYINPKHQDSKKTHTLRHKRSPRPSLHTPKSRRKATPRAVTYRGQGHTAPPPCRCTNCWWRGRRASSTPTRLPRGSRTPPRRTGRTKPSSTPPRDESLRCRRHTLEWHHITSARGEITGGGGCMFVEPGGVVPRARVGV